MSSAVAAASSVRRAIEATDVDEVRALLDGGAVDRALTPVGRASLTSAQLACAALRSRLLEGDADATARALNILTLLLEHRPVALQLQESTGRTCLHTAIARTAVGQDYTDGVGRGLVDDTARDSVAYVFNVMVAHLAAGRRKARIDAGLGETPAQSTGGITLIACEAGVSDAVDIDGSITELSDDVAAATLTLLRRAADGDGESPIITCIRHGNVVALDAILSIALPTLAHAASAQKISGRAAVSGESILTAPPPADAGRGTQHWVAALPLNALHLAAACGQFQMAKYLLQRNTTAHGADTIAAGALPIRRGGWITIAPDAHDVTRVEGGGALHVAASAGHAAIVALLLENGADPALRDRLGRTALHVAAEGPAVKATKVVVGEATPTSPPRTAASTAAADDNTAVLRTLLQYHEDLHAEREASRAVGDEANSTAAGDISSVSAIDSAADYDSSMPEKSTAHDRSTTATNASAVEPASAVSPARKQASIAQRERKRLHAQHLLALVDRGGRSASEAALRVGRSANAAFLMRVGRDLESAAVVARTGTVSRVISCDTHAIDESSGMSASSHAAVAHATGSGHAVDVSVKLSSSATSSALSQSQASTTRSRAAPVTDAEKRAQELLKAMAGSSSAADLWRAHKHHVMSSGGAAASSS